MGNYLKKMTKFDFFLLCILRGGVQLMTKLTIKGSKGTYNTGNIVLSTSNLVYVQLEMFFNILIE